MNLSDYQEASFRGVRFLVPDGDGTVGRNSIEHNYPDSETHYIEDNGKLVRKYTLEACLHGPDVKSQFLALEAALETPGPGTLLHPWLGVKLVSVTECPYSITQREAGIVKFTINCCDAGAPSYPNLVSGSGVAIGGLTATALIAMSDLFAANFKKPLSAVSLATIKDTLSKVTSTVDGVFRSASGLPEILNDVNSAANLYKPERLATALQKLFRSPVKDDEIESEALYRGWSKVVRALEPIYTSFDVTTVDLRDREQSLATVQAYMHSAALIHYCESISYFEYSTADQAIQDRKRLLNAHSLVLETVYPEAKHLIDEIVTETLEYLGSLQVQLPRLETMNLNDWPVGALAYQLYGPDTKNTQVLIDINQDKNLMLYNSEVNVLRNGG